MKLENAVSLYDFFSAHQHEALTPEVLADVSMSDMIDEFSLLLFSYRQEHQMTQGQLAAKLDMSQAMVSSYESGSRNISLKTLSEIAAKLGRSVSLSFTPVQVSIPSNPILTDCNFDDIASAA
ncbi:MAG: helix-turn-helix transcriptional regulator [Clostridia bacterium]|nr:helix-turn-helix transcriptional regulator [Clostridia bacterium]MBR6185930.1 helix-turn-helix transcriptional regulator [Clostridia bacterium]